MVTSSGSRTLWLYFLSEKGCDEAFALCPAMFHCQLEARGMLPIKYEIVTLGPYWPSWYVADSFWRDLGVVGRFLLFHFLLSVFKRKTTWEITPLGPLCCLQRSVLSKQKKYGASIKNVSQNIKGSTRLSDPAPCLKQEIFLEHLTILVICKRRLVPVQDLYQDLCWPNGGLGLHCEFLTSPLCQS